MLAFIPAGCQLYESQVLRINAYLPDSDGNSKALSQFLLLLFLRNFITCSIAFVFAIVGFKNDIHGSTSDLQMGKLTYILALVLLVPDPALSPSCLTNAGFLRGCFALHFTLANFTHPIHPPNPPQTSANAKQLRSKHCNELRKHYNHRAYPVR